MIPLDMIALSMLATFLYVAVRAMQQLNVIHGYYFRIIPTSILMGIGDVVLVMLILKTQTIWLGVMNGFAGAAGCYLAMWINRRFK